MFFINKFIYFIFLGAKKLLPMKIDKILNTCGLNRENGCKALVFLTDSQEDKKYMMTNLSSRISWPAAFKSCSNIL